MARPQRPTVKISDAQKEDYIRLVGEEKRGVSEATRIIALKYDLEEAHHREAVRQMLNKQGIKTPRVKSKVIVVSDTRGNGHKDISLDEGIDLMIRAFAALRKLPEVEAERDRYRRGYENAMSLLKAYDEDGKKRKHQEQIFKLAQQGKIPSIDTPNLTYHI